MQTYNFCKIKKDIEKELENIKNENNEKYLNKILTYEKELYIKFENICDEDYVDFNNMLISNKNELILKNIHNKKIQNIKEISNNNLTKLENIQFKYNAIEKSHFKNIEFTNCNFYGNILNKCILDNVIFKNCSFYDDKECVFKLENTKLLNTKFINCNMQCCIIEEVQFYNVSFENTSLKESIINNSYIDKIQIKDCDLRSLKIINTNIKYLEFEDSYLSKMNEYTFIDKMKIKNIDKQNYKESYKVYQSISSKFKANQFENNAGEYFYISKCMEYKTLKGISKLKSFIFWLLCGYGERPTFALITSLEIVLIFAIMYMITGLNIDGQIINYKEAFFQELPLKDLNSDFMNSLYFSIVTFTTVGYGDITPIEFSIFLSGIEMLLGVTMVGVWTATLTRKITR